MREGNLNQTGPNVDFKGKKQTKEVVITQDLSEYYHNDMINPYLKYADPEEKLINDIKNDGDGSRIQFLREYFNEYKCRYYELEEIKDTKKKKIKQVNMFKNLELFLVRCAINSTQDKKVWDYIPEFVKGSSMGKTIAMALISATPYHYIGIEKQNPNIIDDDLKKMFDSSLERAAKKESIEESKPLNGGKRC